MAYRRPEATLPPKRRTSAPPSLRASPSLDWHQQPENREPKFDGRQTHQADGHVAFAVSSGPSSRDAPLWLRPRRMSSSNIASEESDSSPQPSVQVDYVPRPQQPPPMHSIGTHQLMEDGRDTPPLPSTDHATYLDQSFPGPRSGVKALRAAVTVAKTDLFVTLTRSGDELAPKVAALNLATAQRLVLAHMQQNITKIAHEVLTGRDDRPDIYGLEYELARYCESHRRTKLDTLTTELIWSTSTCRQGAADPRVHARACSTTRKRRRARPFLPQIVEGARKTRYGRCETNTRPCAPQRPVATCSGSQ